MLRLIDLYATAIRLVVVFMAALLSVTTGCQKASTPIPSVPEAAAPIIAQQPQAPRVVIIHLKNVAWTSRQGYVRKYIANPEELSAEEVDARYERYLASIDALQLEQLEILRALAKEHHLNNVFAENVTDQNGTQFIKTLRKIRGTDLEQFKFERDRIDQLVADRPGVLGSKAEQMLKRAVAAPFIEYREDCLKVGAAGRLMLQQDIESVRPLTNDRLLENSIAIQEDGSTGPNVDGIAALQDNMAQRLLTAGPVVLVVLDGSIDLSDNLKKFSTSHKYVIEETASYRQLVDSLSE